MRFHPRLVVTLLLALIVSTARAQNDPAAPDLAKAVAPFLREDTIVVLHADLTRVDFDAIDREVLRVIGKAFGAAEAAKVTQEYKADAGLSRKWLADMLAAKARHAYLVLNLSDLPFAPGLVVVPLEAGADEKAIASLLVSGEKTGPAENAGLAPSQFPGAARTMNGCVVLGSKLALDRAAADAPVARPDISVAFKLTGDAALQGVLVPSDDSRKVIEQLLSRLPKDLGGGPSTILTRGLRAVGAGASLDKAFSFRLICQSQDAAAAKDLLGLVETARAFVARQAAKESPDSPEIAKALALLAPKLDNDRLVLSLDDAAAHALGDLLAPTLQRERDKARAAASMSNLRQITLACMMFAQEHKNQWPDSLDQLVAAKFLTDNVLINPAGSDANPGYVYIKPADAMAGAPATRIVAHEAYDAKTPRVSAAFLDGHVEALAREELEKMLAAQREKPKAP